MVLTAEFLGQQLNQPQHSAFADRPYDLQNLISCPLTTFFSKTQLLQQLPRRLSKVQIPTGIMKLQGWVGFFFCEKAYKQSPSIANSLTMNKFQRALLAGHGNTLVTFPASVYGNDISWVAVRRAAGSWRAGTGREDSHCLICSLLLFK